jgi:hypothetical protein
MAPVIGIERAGELSQPVYDPICGAGSLLITAADEAGTPKLAIYRQEMDVHRGARAHEHDPARARNRRAVAGNTLAAPCFNNLRLHRTPRRRSPDERQEPPDNGDNEIADDAD